MMRVNIMGEMASGMAHEVNQPLAALVRALYPLLLSIQGDLVPSLSEGLPSLQLIVTGALVLVVALFSLSMIED